MTANATDTDGNRGDPMPSVYDEDYYCTECEGYEEFIASDGQVLSNRLTETLSHLDVQPCMRTLDAGCGRGEGLIWLRSRQVETWGVDYSAAALHLALGALGKAGPVPQVATRLLSANVRQLPFASQAFDRVLMLDIVEHLHPWELKDTLKEAWRVLKPGGRMLVHTAPNLWYYRYGYPLFRLFQRLRGVRLPKDPRDRFRYHRRVHVNEQSPVMLRHALEDAGFRPRIWVDDMQQRWMDQGRVARVLGSFVTRSHPLRWVFCGDVLADARKE